MSNESARASLESKLRPILLDVLSGSLDPLDGVRQVAFYRDEIASLGERAQHLADALMGVYSEIEEFTLTDHDSAAHRQRVQYKRQNYLAVEGKNILRWCRGILALLREG